MTYMVQVSPHTRSDPRPEVAQTWSVKAGLRYGLKDEEAQSEAANAEGHASVWAPKGVGCGCKMGGCGGWIFFLIFCGFD